MRWSAVQIKEENAAKEGITTQVLWYFALRQQLFCGGNLCGRQLSVQRSWQVLGRIYSSYRQELR